MIKSNPVVAQGKKRVTVNATLVDSISTRKINFFIYLLLRSGVESERGFELLHSTHNVSKMWQKVENGVS